MAQAEECIKGDCGCADEAEKFLFDGKEMGVENIDVRPDEDNEFNLSNNYGKGYDDLDKTEYDKYLNLREDARGFPTGPLVGSEIKADRIRILKSVIGD